MSDERTCNHDDRTVATPVRATSVIQWMLQKGERVLRCELQCVMPATSEWEMRVFEDGVLLFAQRWPLESAARFFAASLRRERLRTGWSDASTMTAMGHHISVNLTLLARNTCTYAVELISNLHDALAVLRWPTEYRFIDMATLPPTDPNAGYPSPTLLWKGTEIFGMPVPIPPFQPG